ncbi:uncharacterized protein LOC143284136 [Babylonia areolata]|uniref:uncharacterized protein LOC143284136 n=1 Tax=Babylonia areolata TaxID=304850 RepID=UPI003FD26BEC
MGSTHAKKHKEEEEEGSKAPFNSYFSPARERAYFGPPLEYHFVDTQVTVRPQADGFTRTPSLSSEDEGHYALLEQPYHRGFRMLHFTRIPGGLQRTGHCGAAHGSAVLIDFQGIFSRNPSTCGSNSSGVVEMRVEKAWLQASRVHSGLLSRRSVQHVLNTSHVEESVRRGAQGGERLLCVGATGQEDCGVTGTGASGGLSSVVRVDLFFEMTGQLTSEQYTYNTVLVPCKVTYKSQVMFRPVPHVQCEWRATLNQHLSQGWRLVDIYIDIPTVSQFFDPKSQDFSPTTMNALWFFEKPVSRLEDDTPRFEGKVIEHAVKVKSHSTTGGMSSEPGWERVMTDMGRRGWELACVVETHGMECQGLTEILLKSLLFFQRPLAQGHGSPVTSSKGYNTPMTASRSSISD